MPRSAGPDYFAQDASLAPHSSNAELPAPKVQGYPARLSSTGVKGKDTRQRIIVGVWDVLAEKGYAGLTVRLVGQAAGVSHAMIHYYFSSKDDLLVAVVEYARGYWIHPLEDRVFGTGSGSPLMRLEGIIVWMAELATGDVMRVHGQLLAQSEWNDDLRRAMAAEYARWRSGFVELFRQLEEAQLLTDGTNIKLLGAAFATLSDLLVKERALDPTVDSDAIMRESLRPFLRVPVTPTVGGAPRASDPERPRPGRKRRGS